jgi:hypothetical protein
MSTLLMDLTLVDTIPPAYGTLGLSGTPSAEIETGAFGVERLKCK